MLKHAGMLEPQDPGVMPFDETVDLDIRWKEWLRREHNNRYTKSPFPRHFGRCRSYIDPIASLMMPLEADWFGLILKF